MLYIHYIIIVLSVYNVVRMLYRYNNNNIIMTYSGYVYIRARDQGSSAGNTLQLIIYYNFII